MGLFRDALSAGVERGGMEINPLKKVNSIHAFKLPTSALSQTIRSWRSYARTLHSEELFHIPEGSLSLSFHSGAERFKRHSSIHFKATMKCLV